MTSTARPANDQTHLAPDVPPEIDWVLRGTLLAVFAATSADFYGTKHFGVNYGLLFLAWGIAAVAGSQLAGFVFDTFGNYQYAFFGAAVLSVLSLGCLYAAKSPARAA